MLEENESIFVYPDNSSFTSINNNESARRQAMYNFTQIGRVQVAQLSQRNRAAGWVSLWWVVGDGVGQSGANVVGSI